MTDAAPSSVPARSEHPAEGDAAVRVVIAEDEALLRAGLGLVLREGGFDVAAAAGSAPELVAACERHRPDLVVTDIRMPPGHGDDGLRAALEIRARWPEVGVVVLSQHLLRHYAVELLSGPPGRVGYLLKQRVAEVEGFCEDLRRVVGGATVLDPEVARLIVARGRRGHDPVRRLTPRQQEVLELMAEGRSNASIARRLSITERAVVQHTSHIYDQLGLPAGEDDHRRVLAVVRHLLG